MVFDEFVVDYFGMIGVYVVGYVEMVFDCVYVCFYMVGDFEIVGFEVFDLVFVVVVVGVVVDVDG